ncbi:MAG TPA: HD domain-containing phosphohydrolase [Longimicrobiales bacterium]
MMTGIDLGVGGGRRRPAELLVSATAADARILVIDDDPANVRLLSRLLARIGYHNVRGTTDDRNAFTEYGDFVPDLVLLDLRMPHVDGFALLERMRRARPDEAMAPVLVLTADSSPETRRRANELGANAFVTKPYDLDEVALRVGALLELRAHAQAAFRAVPELSAGSRAWDGTSDEFQLLHQLAETCVYRDRLSPGHTGRVGWLAAVIASELRLPGAVVDVVRRCAPLHDLGKIAIPDEILLKPGPLTHEERAVAERHTTIGALILSGSRYPLLRVAAEIALTHHERWDGTGYPRGLKGTDIPIAGRIVAVADVYDALTHERSYKPAWPVSRALGEILTKKGTHFDPLVVAALLRVLDALERTAAA